jgi:SNF2 family DNA or RNA helicase
MLTREDLRGYQNTATDFWKRTRRCLLGLDMGLGKTVSSLTAFSDMWATLDADTCLVIAPLRVAKNVWPAEVRKWSHLRHLRVSVICGTLQERLEAIYKPADIYVINRENIVWLEQVKLFAKTFKKFTVLGDSVKLTASQLEWLIDVVISGKELRNYFEHDKKHRTWTVDAENLELLRNRLAKYEDAASRLVFDTYIVDESTSFKSKGASRWKALRRMSRAAANVALLTGTPTPNSLLEIQPQMQLVDGGKRLGESLERFKILHFFPVEEEKGRRVKWMLRSGHEEIIREKIQDVCMVMKSEDYLQLPERIDEYLWLDIDNAARSRYAELEREYITRMVGGEVVEAVTAAVLANKLLQMANGCVYDENKKAHVLHDEKLEALKEIVEESNGAPILVAYNYKHDLARLRKTFPQAVVLDKNPETENRWNRGEIPILLAHPKSAGHGLNLQFGGSVAVWFGLTWSLEEYLQFNKRLYRSGQRRDVYIKHLVCKGTIDEVVLRVLRRKDKTQESLLKALRAHVSEIKRVTLAA